MGFISGMIKKNEEKLTADDVFARNYGYSYGKKFTHDGAKHSFYAVQQKNGSKSYDILNEIGLLVVRDVKFFYENNSICSIITTDGRYLFLSTEFGNIVSESKPLGYDGIYSDMAKRFITEENGIYDKVSTFFKISDEFLAKNSDFRDVCSTVLFMITDYQRENWDKKMDRLNPRTGKLERMIAFKDEETAQKEFLLLKSKIGGKLFTADMLAMPNGGDYSVHIN